MKFIKKLIPYKLILLRRELLPVWRKIMRKNLKPKKEIPILHLHLTDHCNLNCKGCDNFSPLSPEVFTDIIVFENDCKKMAELSKGKAKEIQLLGGEPLLHPHITSFMAIARKYFPSNTINIISNGTLLKKQKEDFWQSCRTNNINIVVTKYPINIDFKSIEQLVKSHGVSFSFYGNTETVDKTMQCIPLDIEGKQDPRDSFLRCSRANRCVSLDNGKVYPCSLIPYVKYFNQYFNKNLTISEGDYLEIDKATDIQQILKFISTPAPFCRFCNLKGIIWDIGYGASKKDISEWTAVNK